jgi:hypothetical protein
MDGRLRALAAEHGVFLRREAEELGYHDVAIARLVKNGVWVRVRRGAYVYADDWDPLDERGRYLLRSRAVLRQGRTPAVLSHVSAVIAHGSPMWGLDLADVHITRLDGRTGRKERGVNQHQGTLPPEQVVTIGGVPATCGARSLLELTMVTPVEASLCVADDFLHRKVAAESDWIAHYRSMRHWPNSLTTELVLRLARSESESVGETRVRYACWREGLPAPRLQVQIIDGHGRVVARVDMAWPEYGVFLEFDGLVKYTTLLRPGETASEAVVREKKREDLIRELTGWICIRVTWADLADPARLAARIRAALLRRGRIA